MLKINDRIGSNADESVLLEYRTYNRSFYDTRTWRFLSLCYNNLLPVIKLLVD